MSPKRVALTRRRLELRTVKSLEEEEDDDDDDDEQITDEWEELRNRVNTDDELSFKFRSRVVEAGPRAFLAPDPFPDFEHPLDQQGIEETNLHRKTSSR